MDTEEIYDYLEYVEKPMDFDQMLTKLDNGEYHCAQDFLDDIDLVADNAVKYNSDLNYETNKVLCHRAKSLQDFAYALIKADMDTDFEDNCKVCTVYFICCYIQYKFIFYLYQIVIATTDPVGLVRIVT